MMNRTVYVGKLGSIQRHAAAEREVSETIGRNTLVATRTSSERAVAETANAMRTVDGPPTLRGTRYTFGYGVAVRQASRLLDTVHVVGLREALPRIRQEQQEAGDSIEFGPLRSGHLPADLTFRRKNWIDYGFVIVEDVQWGPLMSASRELPARAETKHSISPQRIVELLTLTANAQIGLQTATVQALGAVERKLLRGIVDTQCQYGIRLPGDEAFLLLHLREKELREWRVRINRWEEDYRRAEAHLGVLLGEAVKGHLAWKRHDDEKEIMALARCLEHMWARGTRHRKLKKILDGCRKWMRERRQTEDEINEGVRLLKRFYEDSRNVRAHEASGQPLGTDIARAGLNARVRGLIEDYIWWKLTGERTVTRPTVISRGEDGATACDVVEPARSVIG